MHVIGHDDIGPQIKFVALAGSFDGADEKLFDGVISEQGLATKAGEGEGVGMAGDVEALAGFIRVAHREKE